jgi:hypothetical protein
MPVTHLTFRPFAEVGLEPNVVVDGTPTTNTRLTLSHWPGSPTVPDDVQADLSAQMAFRYLDHTSALHADATAVSNNHFDQDGLVGVFALSNPDAALPRRQRLEDLAAAGDFATYRDRDAARASMVVSALGDPERSPLADLPTDEGARVAALYVDAIGRLPELVDHVGRYEAIWADEDAVLSECEAAIAAGSVTIEERPDVDLAVVDVGAPGSWWGHRFFGRRYDGFHPMALHNATDRGALLLVRGQSYRFTYRYESWVQYRSRDVRLRVDLEPLAAELSSLDDVAWSSDPVGGLTPELGPVDGATSALPAATVVDVVCRHLGSAPVAFDPFSPPGG